MIDPEQKAVAEQFDRYHANYSEAVNDALIVPGLKVDFFSRVKADYLLELIARRYGARHAVEVLDVGCGVGLSHAMLQRNGATLAGVDVSKQCLARARQLNPTVDYRGYDGEVLPWPDDSFDVAFAICVLHHVPAAKWPRFVAEMRRVVRPGGLLAVFEHNPHNPLTMRVVNRCPFDQDAELLPAARTVALFRAAGLNRVRCRYILCVPAANAVLRRVDALFSRVPLGAQYFVAGEA